MPCAPHPLRGLSDGPFRKGLRCSVKHEGKRSKTKTRISVFRHSREGGNPEGLTSFWMPDQVRHDEGKGTDLRSVPEIKPSPSNLRRCSVPSMQPTNRQDCRFAQRTLPEGRGTGMCRVSIAAFIGESECLFERSEFAFAPMKARSAGESRSDQIVGGPFFW
jgi:hypothetical protein